MIEDCNVMKIPTKAEQLILRVISNVAKVLGKRIKNGEFVTYEETDSLPHALQGNSYKDIKSRIKYLIDSGQGVPICGFLGDFDEENKKVIVYKLPLEALCEELSEKFENSKITEKIGQIWKNSLWYLAHLFLRDFLESITSAGVNTNTSEYEKYLCEFVRKYFESINEKVKPNYDNMRDIVLLHTAAHAVLEEVEASGLGFSTKGTDKENLANLFAFLNAPTDLKPLFIAKSMIQPPSQRRWIKMLPSI